MLTKNLALAFLLTTTLSSVALAAGKACEQIFMPNDQIFVIPERAQGNLRAEMNAEGSHVTKAFYKQSSAIATKVGHESDFSAQLKTVQDQALAALEAGTAFNGWKVSKITLDSTGRLPMEYYSLFESSTFQRYIDGTPTLLKLEKGNDLMLLNTASNGTKLTTSELLLIKGHKSKFSETFVFGMKMPDLMDRTLPDITPNMTPEQRHAAFEEYQNPVLRGFGTIEGAKQSIKILAELQGKEPTRQADPSIANWEMFNKDYLRLGGPLRIRTVIKSLASLHKKQQGLRGDHRVSSHFIYDDRGSLRTGTQFKIPSGEMVKAREGSVLLSINSYVDIRLVLDVPRAQDNSVRLWIWDDRHSKWAESYVIPLNKDAKDLGITGATSQMLSIVYPRLLDVRQDMLMRDGELKRGEHGDD